MSGITKFVHVHVAKLHVFDFVTSLCFVHAETKSRHRKTPDRRDDDKAEGDDSG